jgi:hypothetical protein
VSSLSRPTAVITIHEAAGGRPDERGESFEKKHSKGNERQPSSCIPDHSTADHTWGRHMANQHRVFTSCPLLSIIAITDS